jgi:hypothetical protein
MATPAPAEPMPLILTNAGLKINDVELACLVNHIEISPDVSITTLDTMCGSRDYPGVVKWALVATLYQSFDSGATEEVLSEAVQGGVPVPFEVVGYRDQPVSEANPMWSGEVIPQPYSPINGDAGDASTIDLEWSIVGEPTKNITEPAALAGATSSTSSTSSASA